MSPGGVGAAPATPGRGHGLWRSGAYNLMGALVPAVALFVTIPVVVARLGAEAWGALTLVTSVVGYFGLLDVNAAGGTVKFVAEHHARQQPRALDEVIWAGLSIQLLLGLAGCAALVAGADWLVHVAFRVEPAWQTECIAALRLSGAAYLVMQLHLWLQSLPQGLHRFDLVGRCDAVFGALAPLATLAVVLAGGGLLAIVQVRLAVALAHFGVLALLVRHLHPALRLRRPAASVWRRMVSFSVFGWLQRVAALTGQHGDKLLLGAQQSLGLLAAYAIPVTLGGRVFGLLFRLQQAVFPWASALAAHERHDELLRDCVQLQRYTGYLQVCACLLCALFARELMHHWLQGRVPAVSSWVLVLVAYTLLADGFTQVLSLVNDGLGHPRHTALAALLRAAAGLGAAALALAQGGLLWLAASQVVVALAVALGFIAWVHARTLPWRASDFIGPAFGPSLVALGLGTGVVAWRHDAGVLEAGAFAAALAGCVLLLVAYGWWVVLHPADRQRLSRWRQP